MFCLSSEIVLGMCCLGLELCVNVLRMLCRSIEQYQTSQDYWFPLAAGISTAVLCHAHLAKNLEGMDNLIAKRSCRHLRVSVARIPAHIGIALIMVVVIF